MRTKAQLADIFYNIFREKIRGLYLSFAIELWGLDVEKTPDEEVQKFLDSIIDGHPDAPYALMAGAETTFGLDEQAELAQKGVTMAELRSSGLITDDKKVPAICYDRFVLARRELAKENIKQQAVATIAHAAHEVDVLVEGLKGQGANLQAIIKFCSEKDLAITLKAENERYGSRVKLLSDCVNSQLNLAAMFGCIVKQAEDNYVSMRAALKEGSFGVDVMADDETPAHDNTAAFAERTRVMYLEKKSPQAQSHAKFEEQCFIRAVRYVKDAAFRSGRQDIRLAADGLESFCKGYLMPEQKENNLHCIFARSLTPEYGIGIVAGVGY